MTTLETLLYTSLYLDISIMTEFCLRVRQADKWHSKGPVYMHEGTLFEYIIVFVPKVCYSSDLKYLIIFFGIIDFIFEMY